LNDCENKEKQVRATYQHEEKEEHGLSFLISMAEEIHILFAVDPVYRGVMGGEAKSKGH
jgi:hypothetical protein